LAPKLKNTPIPRCGSPPGCQRYWSRLLPRRLCRDQQAREETLEDASKDRPRVAQPGEPLLEEEAADVPGILLMSSLPPAITITPLSNASVTSLLVTVPPGSMASAERTRPSNGSTTTPPP